MTDRQAERNGILLLIAASALWSLNGALIKLINAAGLSGVTIAAYRSLFAGLLLLPMARRGWRTLLIDRPPPPPPLPRGDTGGSTAKNQNEKKWNTLRPKPAAIACVVFFTAMTACFVIANTMTQSANAIILQYTSTFWIFGLSPMILGEKASSRELRCLVLAMVGIGIIFAGSASATLGGLLVALLAGLFYALLTLMIRRLRHADAAALTVLNCLGSAVLLLPVAAFTDTLVLSRRSFFLLLLMGLVQFGLPYYLYSLGLARVPAYKSALVTLLEPVLVPVWAYLVVGDVPPTMTLIGGSFVLGAFVWIVVSTAKRAAATEVSAIDHHLEVPALSRATVDE